MTGRLPAPFVRPDIVADVSPAIRKFRSPLLTSVRDPHRPMTEALRPFHASDCRSALFLSTPNPRNRSNKREQQTTYTTQTLNKVGAIERPTWYSGYIGQKQKRPPARWPFSLWRTQPGGPFKPSFGLSGLGQTVQSPQTTTLFPSIVRNRPF